MAKFSHSRVVREHDARRRNYLTAQIQIDIVENDLPREAVAEVLMEHMTTTQMQKVVDRWQGMAELKSKTPSMNSL